MKEEEDNELKARMLALELIEFHHVQVVQAMKMKPDDENDSVLAIMDHYGVPLNIYFNVETRVGEVFQVNLEDGEEYEYGVITVEKLKELLKGLPHIADFVEGNAEVLH